MKERIAEPLRLSEDFENNLYRNVVHVLAESENMIPGGQAERIIPIMKALLREEIENVENPHKLGILYTINDWHEGFEQCRQKILSLLRGKGYVKKD